MQYVLTEDEYKALANRPSHNEVTKLQGTIDKLALIYVEKNGCMHDDNVHNSAYCDDCSLASLYKACSLPKDFSQ